MKLRESVARLSFVFHHPPEGVYKTRFFAFFGCPLSTLLSRLSPRVRKAEEDRQKSKPLCFVVVLFIYFSCSFSFFLVSVLFVQCSHRHFPRARKAEERQKKEAELRRLKNLKREEIRRRLQAIQEMSGGALVDDGEGGGVGGEPDGVGEDAQALIEGDFDAERWGLNQLISQSVINHPGFNGWTDRSID